MLDTIPFTSVVNNLEHGLAILTESFSPLRSIFHNVSTRFPFIPCTLELDPAGLIWFEPATATKIDAITRRQMSSGTFHYYPNS